MMMTLRGWPKIPENRNNRKILVSPGLKIEFNLADRQASKYILLDLCYSVVVVTFMSCDLRNHVLCRVRHLVNRFIVFSESRGFSSLAKLLHLATRIKVKHKQSGIVIRFDNHMTSQRGGHSKIREFSYSLRFARYLFDYTRVIYP